MKRCPTCNQQYNDDLDYCLNDGTPLVQAGMVISFEPETATVVAQRSVPPPPAAAKSSIPFYVWLLPILGVVLGAMAMGGLFLLSRMGKNDGANTAVLTNTSKSPSAANNAASPTASPSTTASPSPTASPKASPQPSSTPAPTPSAPALKSYPATTRLRFARGAVSSGFSGDLNPNGSRSLVLACMPGQRLSASVSSAGNCVSFSGGGTSYSTYTSGGDNFLRLSNRCSTVTNFRVSITII
jgi:hypothetical protein